MTAPHPVRPSQLQDGAEPSLPQDNSDEVTTALIATWVVLGLLIIVLVVSYFTCGLTTRLDLIGVMDGTSTKQTSAGALVVSVGLCVLTGALISVVAGYCLNNTWGSSSLITPQPADLRTKWQVSLTITPMSSDVTFTAPAFSIESGWHQTSPGVWSCQSCVLTDAVFSVRSTSWTTYAYEVTWSVATTMSALSGSQNTSVATILKGGVGTVNVLATPTLIRQDGEQSTGTTLRHGIITPVPTINATQVMTTTTLGLDLHITNTENWRLNAIYGRQGAWSILAQLVGMASGVMTLVRLAMSAVERRHRSKPLL